MSAWYIWLHLLNSEVSREKRVHQLTTCYWHVVVEAFCIPADNFPAVHSWNRMRSDITKRNQCPYLRITFGGVCVIQQHLKSCLRSLHWTTALESKKSLNYRICYEKQKCNNNCETKSRQSATTCGYWQHNFFALNKNTRSFSIINWIDNVNWPPQRV